MLSDDRSTYLEKMPHFIARNYQALLSAADPETVVRAGLASFTHGLRYLTIILISEYLTRDKENISDPHLNELIVRDLPLGMLQTWTDVFFWMMKVYEGYPKLLFLPELYDFYWDVSRLEEHQPREDLVRTIKRMVALRNSLALQRLPGSPGGWHERADEVKEHLSFLFSRLGFLTRYNLLRILDVDQGQVTAELHMGIHPAQIVLSPGRFHLQPNWYYLSDGNGDYLQLEPLLTGWDTDPDVVALFQARNKYDELIYLLTHTGKTSISGKDRAEEFTELIETIELRKQKLFGKNDITWLRIVADAQVISRRLMSTAAGKYDPEVYLQRGQVLDHFRDFLHSAKSCFVLTGRSGAGKSSFVLSLQEEFSPDPNICLLVIDAAAAEAASGLSEYLTQAFRKQWGLTPDEFPDFWGICASLAGQQRGKLVLVLDGINENANAADLLEQVNDLLLQDWPWLKVMITSRPETWRKISTGKRLANDRFYVAPAGMQTLIDELPELSALDLGQFSWGELSAVYDLYRVKYGLKTGYAELKPVVRDLIREPLNLWMIANTCAGKALPPETAAEKIIDEYMGALLRTGRIKPQDKDMLERELVPLFAGGPGTYKKTIGLIDLDRAGNDLKARVYDTGELDTGELIRESFQRLVDAQIMVSRLQGSESNVEFRLERFYDYFVGMYLYRQIEGWYGSAEQGYQALLEEMKTAPFLWGAVQRSLSLSIQANDLGVLHSLVYLETPEAAHLVASTLKAYAAHSPDLVRELTREWLNRSPSARQKLAAVQRAKQVALRVALGMGDLDALQLGLLDRNRVVQDTAVKYVFFLDEIRPVDSLRVVREVSQHVTRFGLPNPRLLQVLFPLVILLQMEQHRRDSGRNRPGSSTEWLALLKDILRRVSYVGKTGGPTQFFGNFSRTLLVRLLMQRIREMMRNNLDEVKKHPDRLRVSVNNLEEFALFYHLPEETRRAVRETIPYLNREHGSLADISENLYRVYVSGDIAGITFVNMVVNSRGRSAPADCLAAYRSVFDRITQEHAGNRNLTAFCATSVAHNVSSILERQENERLRPEWLEFLKTLAREHIENAPYGYSVTATSISRYLYHTLIFYGAAWNRYHPQEEIDLVQEYLARAEETGDRELLYYVIDSFGDRRVSISDYRPILRSLCPFVHNPDIEIHRRLVATLANIYSRKPDQVEHFLLEANAPEILGHEIRQRSFTEPVYELTIRFGEFINDFLMEGPVSSVQGLVETMQKVERASSVDAGLEILIREVASRVIGEKVFL